MLTTELLNENTTTAALSDEQKAAIVEMSKNDENTVIGKRIGEIYRDLDADILEASGVAKEGAEKTYDYAKRVIGGMKETADASAANAAKVASLEKEKTRLEGIIASGNGDEETKKALKKAQADLTNVTKEYTELKTKFDEAETAHAKALLDVRMEGEFAKAGAGLKFKADLPEAVKGVLLNQAIATVKGMNPEYIDDGKGGKVLAFMKDSAVLRNPETNLAPYTASELVSKELKAMGVLEEGRKQTGTGSTPTATADPNAAVDVSGARTQVEADDIIGKALLAKGLARGTMAYQKEFDAVRLANYDAIKALPLK